MNLNQTPKPHWTLAWTRWGTRCSALVQGETILKALDGFSRIDANDVAKVLHQQEVHN